PRRNANGVSTTTSAFSVVQRATRPTSVVSRPRGLMPTPHESPPTEMTLPQKTIKQPMEHGTTLRLLQLRSCQTYTQYPFFSSFSLSLCLFSIHFFSFSSTIRLRH